MSSTLLRSPPTWLACKTNSADCPNLSPQVLCFCGACLGVDCCVCPAALGTTYVQKSRCVCVCVPVCVRWMEIALALLASERQRVLSVGRVM